MKYTEKQIRELYRIDNKYWKTGDIDFAKLAIEAARVIDQKYWDCVKNIADFACRKHMPVQTVIDALALFGYECEEEAE